jgi:hypothetical protein
LKLRITSALAFAVAGMALLASSATASTAAGSAVPAGLPACGDPANTCVGHRVLPMGAHFSAPDRKATLVFQFDGNLVDYDEHGRARWASNTIHRGSRCVFQTDGNLVVYAADGRPVWASNTAGHARDYLVVQGDGNIVIYDPGDRVLWATHTQH